MPGIGDTLREARMRAHIDVSEIEASTKIRAKYIRAIENEEWDLLPGSTFVKSFIRTYADELGLDSKLLIEEFKLRHEGVEQVDLQPIAPPLGEHSRVRPRRPPRPRFPRGWIIGLSVVGVLAALIILGSIGGGNGRKGSSTTETRARTTTQPARRTTAAPAPAPDTVKLQLLPDSDVYVCLRDADGKLLVNSTLTPDSAPKTYSSKSFRLTVGNSAVAMRVNGKELKVASSSKPTNYELTPSGRKQLADDKNAC